MNIIVLVIISAIPLIYGGLLSSAYQDPVENVSRMRAAVVNQDSPFTATLATGSEETFDLGHQLENELTHPADGEDVGFTWVSMTEDDAKKAIKDEDIRAYMVIPQGFSQTAGTLGTQDAGNARKVQLGIYTDDGVNYIAGTMARTVAATLQGQLGAQAAQQYIDQVLVSMTTVKDGLTQAADGSDQLLAGTNDLHSGLMTLSEALTTADSGATTLASGADQVADGATSLKDGSKQLADGSVALAAGTTSLVDGSATLSRGVTSYTQGADQLAAGLAQLASQAPALKQGAEQLAAGSATLQQGVAVLPESADALVSGVARASAGATQVSQGAAQVSTGLNGLAAQCAAVVDSQAGAFCQSLQSLAGAQGAVAAGAKAVTDGLGTAADTAESNTLYGGLNMLKASAPRIAKGAQDLANGAAALNTSVGTMQDTAAEKTVLGALNSLHTGAQQLSAQSDVLRSGASDLAAGTVQANQGAQSLAQGARDLNSGAGTLESGAHSVAAGAQDLSSGVSQIKTGAGSARDGAQALESGASDLAAALSSGAQQVPAYSDEDQANIAATASAIAEVTPVRHNAVSNAAGGFSPMFLALSLWIGGIAMFLVLPALDRRHTTRETWWKSATRPMSIAAIVAVAQAVLAVVLVNLMVQMHAAHIWGFIAIAVLSSLTFVAVNQACVAVLSYRGRFVSLMLLILQITSMGGTFPVETAPKFFQDLHSWLPMTWTHYAFRAMIAGEGIPQALSAAALHLLVWLVAALVVVFVAAKVRASRRPLAHDNANLGDMIDSDKAPFGTEGVEKADVNAIDEVVDSTLAALGR